MEQNQKKSIRFERPLRGMLAAHKPKGMISKDLSRWIEKRIGRQKLGHVGTLDPMAEGVLCLLFGSATRLQDHLLEMPKTYEFDMKLGVETDTYDTDGTITAETDASGITRADIEGVLERFRGPIKQVPPVFSAVKYKGKPLYEYARKNQGDQVPIAELERSVVIQSLELLDFESGIATLRARCSKGTYIRSLIRDMAYAAGTIATLNRLIRTEASGATLATCVTLDDMEKALAESPENFAKMIQPPEQLALGLPVWQAMHLDCLSRLQKGQTVSVNADSWLANMKSGSSKGTLGNENPLQVMLLDDRGQAFGLGESKMIEGGRFLITMKRGLS